MDLRTGKIDYNKESVLVTGAYGMIGSALRSILPKTSNIICPTIQDANLTNRQQVFNMIQLLKPSYIIHLAAKVGGVKANSDYLADFYSQNIRMNTNVLDAAHVNKVKKVVSLMSTCVYPDKTEYPLRESNIHNGEPHKSNYAYAHAKRMLDIQSKAYRDQFGDNFITIIPNNLYGAHDYFDLDNSHVIPGMIRKFYEAVLNNTEVTLWGSGSPLREFTYSKDLAEIILFILEEYNGREPLNVGCIDEYNMKDVAHMIAKHLGYSKNSIIWDTTKPNGQFRKPSSNDNFKEFVEKSGKHLDYITLNEGLKYMCDWFVESYPDIRGF